MPNIRDNRIVRVSRLMRFTVFTASYALPKSLNQIGPHARKIPTHSQRPAKTLAKCGYPCPGQRRATAARPLIQPPPVRIRMSRHRLAPKPAPSSSQRPGENARQMRLSLPRPKTCNCRPSADTAAAGADTNVPSPIGSQASAQFEPASGENARQMRLSLPRPKTCNCCPSADTARCRC